MSQIKEQKEIISGEKRVSQTLATNDQVKELVSNRVDEIINEKLNQLQDKIERKIDVKEMKTTEVLAIFITLFTFISVNISIFTRVADVYTAIWFMLLMTVCSIILLSFLFLIIENKNDRNTWIGLITALIFITFLILVSVSDKWNPKLNEIKNNEQTIIKK